MEVGFRTLIGVLFIQSFLAGPVGWAVDLEQGYGGYAADEERSETDYRSDSSARVPVPRLRPAAEIPPQNGQNADEDSSDEEYLSRASTYCTYVGGTIATAAVFVGSGMIWYGVEHPENRVMVCCVGAALNVFGVGSLVRLGKKYCFKPQAQSTAPE